jgi:hypothetical protein
MLTIIVWTNIIVIEIGFILGAALLLSKAGNEDDSDDPSRMSSTEVCSLHLPPHDMACLLNFRSKCFEDWGQFSSRLVSSGCASFAIFGKGWLQLLLSKIISSPPTFALLRIQLAISLLQEAAACITAMVGLPFYCLVQACGFVGFSAIWLLYTTYLVSSAEITTNKDPVTGASYKEYQYSDRAKQSVSPFFPLFITTVHEFHDLLQAIFMVFMWLWTTAFIQAIGQVLFILLLLLLS